MLIEVFGWGFNKKRNNISDHLTTISFHSRIGSAKYNENSVKIADDNNILLFDSESLAEMLFDIIDDLDEQRYKLGYIKRYEHV